MTKSDAGVPKAKTTKIGGSQELTLDEITIVVWKNQRSDLGEYIERYWGGREDSIIGAQYLQLKDGRVHTRKHYFYERRDILQIHFKDSHRGGIQGSAFIEPDGSVQVQHASKTTEALLRAAAAFVYAREKKYVDHENKFFADEPWKDVDGMTVTDAAAYLKKWS